MAGFIDVMFPFLRDRNKEFRDSQAKAKKTAAKPAPKANIGKQARSGMQGRRGRMEDALSAARQARGGNRKKKKNGGGLRD